LSVARSQSAGPGGRSPRKGTRQSMLAKERDAADSHTKPLQRHPRPSEISLDLIFDTPSKSLPKVHCGNTPRFLKYFTAIFQTRKSLIQSSHTLCLRRRSFVFSACAFFMYGSDLRAHFWELARAATLSFLIAVNNQIAISRINIQNFRQCERPINETFLC
jgi:hypothetical protein